VHEFVLASTLVSFEGVDPALQLQLVYSTVAVGGTNRKASSIPWLDLHLTES
jgi:hypothetical protein